MLNLWTTCHAAKVKSTEDLEVEEQVKVLEQMIRPGTEIKCCGDPSIQEIKSGWSISPRIFQFHPFTHLVPNCQVVSAFCVEL